jgi:hypothetical protein
MSGQSNVVPFRPRQRPPARIISFRIRAGDLKQAVINAYLDHLIEARDVESVFREYGLEHD